MKFIASKCSSDTFRINYEYSKHKIRHILRKIIIQIHISLQLHHHSYIDLFIWHLFESHFLIEHNDVFLRMEKSVQKYLTV